MLNGWSQYKKLSAKCIKSGKCVATSILSHIHLLYVFTGTPPTFCMLVTLRLLHI